MRIENGAVVSSVSGAIGDILDGQGAAYIDGAGSQWNMTGDLDVGEGTARLEITNGGTVSNLNAVIGTGGTRPIDILVDGPGSQWNSSGAMTGGSLGTMTISGGGTVNADSTVSGVNFTLDGPGSRWDITNNANLGASTASPSTVSNNALLQSGSALLNNIDLNFTTGGTWNNLGPLTINGTSSATMRLTDGGIVTNTDATLVSSAGRFADVIVEGPGSIWESHGLLTVGGAADNGAGSGGVANLTISNGGNVYSDEAVAATVATAQSTIMLEGNGSRWNIGGGLILGGPDLATTGGTADMTVAGGSSVQTLSTLKVHLGSSLTLLGGTVEVPTGADLVIDQTDGFNFHFGTLRYTGDATLGFSQMQTILGTVPTLGPGQTLQIGGIATLNSALIIDGGTFAAGQLPSSSGSLFLNGTMALTNDNLLIGFGGLFGPNLTLQSNRTLFIGNTVTVNPGSVLTVDQTTMTAGSLNNQGEVVLNGASAHLDGGSIDNFGLLTGNGRLGLGLLNDATGTVRVAAGNHLIADGGQNFNDGRIDLTGGTLEFTQFTQNNSGGLIIGQGTLISRTAFLNDGEMAFSGATNLVGDVSNSAAGLIVVTGVGPTTFFDDLTHNGELRTSAGATTVFLGSVGGTGSFTGTGTTRFEGDFTPGASPADINFAGDVELTGTATLQIEVFGNGGIAGVDFDRLSIAGDADLDGTLLILPDAAYTPTPGDSFQIIAAGNRNGVFANVLGTDLGGGLSFDVIYGANDVLLQVIGGALPGDLNGDGFVGLDDLDIVLTNWNQTVPPGNPLADPSGDGFVGLDDLDLVLTNWNNGTPPTEGAAIPEPGACVMWGVLGVLSIRRYRTAC